MVPPESIADVSENARACPRCGAPAQVDHGTCLNCLLLEGIEGKGEGSRETFESILLEANVADTHWRLGHYEILEEIGRGGMGVIYRARQQHSRRIVAVKRIFAHQVNSHDTLVRFRREAEAVASLDHPSILPVYEVSESEEGLPYFSMKYATGGSLRTVAPALRTKPRECVQLMAKVARGIAYAHSKGVLHRDLQPGNILLDENGQPMVSDFGLAKWLDQTSDLTRTLETLGTPGYIAPEQAECRASQLTGAADTYSLGAILFYLLTGQPPFVGPNVLYVIHQAAATSAPKLRSLAPTLDRDLETICARCLEREPQARYRSAGDLAVDLERWLEDRPIVARRVSPPVRVWRWSKRNRTAAIAMAAAFCSAVAAALLFLSHRAELPFAPSEKSIAVLPFKNLSDDKQNAYFADGIQDEILTRLSKIADLKVISRTSTEKYRNAPRNLREIAQQLGVSSILEGEIQKSADQARITVQLINAVTDGHLWAESYDRKLSDIFQVESDVAQKIATVLEAKLTGREKSDIASVGTQNSEAYDAYLRARAIYHDPAADSLQRTEQALEEAVRLDPNFAAAWAMLGWMQTYGPKIYGPASGSTERGKKAIETALRLQPDLLEAQFAKGRYESSVMRDYDAGRRTFEQLQSRWPNNPDVLESLGTIALRQGRWKEAREYFDAAITLNPRDYVLRRGAVSARFFARDFAAALRVIDQALAIWPDNSGGFIEYKATVYQVLGQLDQADELLSRVHPREGDFDFLVEAICTQAMLRRDPAPAITLLRTLIKPPKSAPPFEQAHYNYHLGQLEQLAGNATETRTCFTEARQILEKELQQPHDAQEAAQEAVYLAVALAGLGEREAALRWADRAVELRPSSKDARGGPGWEEARARIQARFGDGDRAIPTLKHLLETSYEDPLTPATLRLDPDFDPLRSDPRFQKLVEEAKKPVVLK